MSARTLLLRHAGLEQRACFATADAAPSPETFLSDGENERLQGLQFAAKREGFLLGRLAAKRALGALLEETDLRRIEIRNGIFGQPLVHHPRAGSAEVTVSHSHGHAVALAYPAQFPMGIDLETIAQISAPAVLGELEASPAELTWLATGGVDEATACGVLWSAREALGKALRTGLNGPLGILALSGIRSGGDAWSGEYLNFPRCRFLSRSQGGSVLSLCLPAEVELDGLPPPAH